jgi:hypothetical protein
VGQRRASARCPQKERCYQGHQVNTQTIGALEKAPIAPIPKSESIPLLWEKSKDLKERNFNDLINACHEHDDYRQCDEKTKEENRLREKFAREDEEYLKKQQREKNPAEEINETDEEEVPSSKERKRTASDIFSVLPDEGTCANSNFNCTTFVLCCAHMLFAIVTVQTIAHALFGRIPMHMPLRTLLRAPVWICMFSIIPPCKIVAATHNCN